MRVAIGKRREYKPCVQKVERTACKDCPKKGSECAECDYLAIYDGADEAIKAEYYKQYRAVRDIQSERENEPKKAPKSAGTDFGAGCKRIRSSCAN